MFFVLSLNENLLLFLQSLVFDFLFGNQLNRELAGLFDNPFVLLFFIGTCSGPSNQLIKNDAACVDVLSLKELMCDTYFAHDNRINVDHFEHLSCHQL